MFDYINVFTEEAKKCCEPSQRIQIEKSTGSLLILLPKINRVLLDCKMKPGNTGFFVPKIQASVAGAFLEMGQNWDKFHKSIKKGLG